MSDPQPDIQPLPPSATRVVRRALTLAALSYRAWLEQAAVAAESESRRRELIEWFDWLQIRDELEEDEALFLFVPVGKPRPRDTINFSWRIEGASVLAWALGRFELPAHDEETDPDSLNRSLGVLECHIAEHFGSPMLRPEDEIGQLAAQMLAVHWRLREFYHISRTPIDFVKWGRESYLGQWADVTGIRLIDGDLAIRTDPIAKAPLSEVERCMSVALERHQAVNWLMGYDPVYSEVATTT